MQEKILNMAPEKCQDAFLALTDITDVLGGKWKLLILLYLSIRINEENYFKQMQKALFGISAKVLSKELKDLEMNKMVMRIVHDAKLVKVEYSLTAYGKSIIPIAESMLNWALKHRQVILNHS
jgi:DNA-binding HxlR family transcriptional regulator